MLKSHIESCLVCGCNIHLTTGFVNAERHAKKQRHKASYGSAPIEKAFDEGACRRPCMWTQPDVVCFSISFSAQSPAIFQYVAAQNRWKRAKRPESSDATCDMSILNLVDLSLSRVLSLEEREGSSEVEYAAEHP